MFFGKERDRVNDKDLDKDKDEKDSKNVKMISEKDEEQG